MKPNPFLSQDQAEPLTPATDAEIATFRRMNPVLADREFGPVSYDNGVPADGLSGVGL